MVQFMGDSRGTLQPSLLPLKPSRRILRSRCLASTGYAVFGDRGVIAFQVPKGFLEAI